MTVQSIGDQARAFAMQSASSRIKTTLATLTGELASGEVADLGARLGGNTQSLAAIEARLTMLAQYRSNAAEAALQATSMQGALNAIHTMSDSLGRDLFIAPDATTEGLLEARSGDAAQTFRMAVGHLSASVGQKFLFSGVAADTPPLVPADDILAQLGTLTSGLTTAADVAQAVSDWFDAPAGMGGYADLAYRGGPSGSTGRVGEDVDVSLETTAMSPSVRDTLKAIATAAMVDRGALSGNAAERRALMAEAGKAMLDGAPRRVAEMAGIGYAEQAIASAQTEGEAASSTLTTARNTLRAADPFATAAAIKDAETRLSSLYAVIGRLSQLKLADYI